VSFLTQELLEEGKRSLIDVGSASLPTKFFLFFSLCMVSELSIPRFDKAAEVNDGLYVTAEAVITNAEGLGIFHIIRLD